MSKLISTHDVVSLDRDCGWENSDQGRAWCSGARCRWEDWKSVKFGWTYPLDPFCIFQQEKKTSPGRTGLRIFRVYIKPPVKKHDSMKQRTPQLFLMRQIRFLQLHWTDNICCFYFRIPQFFSVLGPRSNIRSRRTFRRLCILGVGFFIMNHISPIIRIINPGYQKTGFQIVVYVCSGLHIQFSKWLIRSRFFKIKV